ncbi:MAG: histidine kinase [Bacteroidetes bacterium]|nr:histidine kinase [Bacteroidota bacterium]
MRKRRYTLFNVFWVVLAVNLCLYIIGVAVIKLIESPNVADAGSQLFTLKYLLKQLINISFQTLFYFFSLNYYNNLIVERSKAVNYVVITVILLVISFFYFMGMHYAFPEASTGQMGKVANTAIYIFSFSVSALFFTGIALLLAYLNNLREEKKQRKILEAQKMQLEVDNSQANFKFLKSQINPHFLHNTLNFLYAKSLPYSAELSEGILTLSDIMRYALSEAASSDGKAPLKDEIEHVRNVIKINQLRFSNNLHVNFEVQGVVNGAMIIPFVLITIVENAFKHGDLQKQEYPIDIKLRIDHQKLFFYCRNKKKSGPKEISTGLGLDNIRNRLDFAYGNNYTLAIKDEADFYTTELTIDQL